MMSEDALIRAISTFYFMAFLDERLTRAAAVKTHSMCSQKLKRGQIEANQVPALLVHLTFKHWKKFSNTRRMSGKTNLEASLLVPEKLDLGPWKQFQREVASEELLSVIWSKILGFSDEQIASGLGVTPGTVRYRVGKGLKHLGRMLA